MGTWALLRYGMDDKLFICFCVANLNMHLLLVNFVSSVVLTTTRCPQTAAIQFFGIY